MLKRALAGKKMVSVENKLSVRTIFAAAVILSIFVAGSLLTGAPLANAQTEEENFLEYRLENIENLLAEIKKEIDNIHTTYVTIEKLEDELEILSLKVSSDIAAVSSDIEAVLTEVENIQEDMEKNSLWVQGTGIGVLVMILWGVLNQGLKYYQSTK